MRKDTWVSTHGRGDPRWSEWCLKAFSPLACGKVKRAAFQTATCIPCPVVQSMRHRSVAALGFQWLNRLPSPVPGLELGRPPKVPLDCFSPTRLQPPTRL
ncbi:UNVERIFIED_CONTAM: hypothetical protein K2H54_011287 [Gekko kuhli]